MELFQAVVFLSLAVFANGHPPGHLKPLGSHLPPMLEIPSLDKFPSPTDFYENYVKPGRPVLIRKILENGDIPAYYRWTDDYLSKHYGNVPVEVEIGKKEDRKNGDMVKLKLSEFLKHYHQMDAYMVHDLPEKMQEDFSLPFTLMCGGFQKVIRTIVTWFSSGGTKSHLHNDNLDNINCLLDGKKDLVLFDKEYNDLIEADDYNYDGSYSNVDVESVDMYKFPKLQNIPWYQVNLTKGDCFFIPYRWYHHVYSHPGRNFAVNVWFYHLWWFNKTDCKGMDDHKATTIPFTDFPKPLKIEEHRQEFLSMFEGKDFITRNVFSTALNDMVKDCDHIFDRIDDNKNGEISWEELYSFGDEMFQTELGNFLMQLSGSDVTESGEVEEESEEPRIDDLISKGIINQELDNGRIENIVDGEDIEIGDKGKMVDGVKDEIDNDTNGGKRDEL